MKKHFKKILIASAAALLSACGQNKPVDLSKETGSVSYKVGKIISRKFSSSVKLPGELKPFEEVKIFPKVNGFVKEVRVDRGSRVHAGDPLITLEAPEVQQQLLAERAKELQAEENFRVSKDKYERLLAASKTEGAVSAFDLQSMKSKMNEDEALVNSEKSSVSALEALTGYLTISAPFDGVITERNVHPGALVGPNAKMELPLLILEQENKLRLVVFVPEVFSGKVDHDAKVKFTVNSFPDKQFEGTISRRAGALNEAMRAEAVEVDVAGNEDLIKPGMYAEVNVPLTTAASSFVAPSSAVITSTERKYVLCVKNGKLKFADVREGITQNDSTEIFGNVQAGDQIILNGNSEMKEGAVVPGTHEPGSLANRP